MATFRQHSSDREATDPSGDELLDLPLGNGADDEPRVRESAAGVPALRVRRVEGRPSPGNGRRQSGFRPRRRPWPWLLLLAIGLPAAVAGGYLLNLSPPVAVLSEDFLDFGEARLGTVGESLAIEVRNLGQKALSIDVVALGGEAAGDFALAADGCSGRQLAGGGDRLPERWLAGDRPSSCSVELAFAPASRGLRRARLELSSNATNGTVGLPLLGAGLVPELRFEPPRLDFGSLKVGAASATASLFLANGGSAPLTVSRVELGGLGAADFIRLADGCSDRALGPGERCAVELRFVPTAEGVRRAEVAIMSDAPPAIQGGPRGPWLVGIGLPRTPLLRLDPERLELGSWPLGEASPPAAVRLLNEGDGPLEIVGVDASVAEIAPLAGDLEGVPADRSVAEAGFELAADGCSGRSVAPGAECRLEVVFRPREEGEARAFFEIRHSAEQGVGSLAVFAAGVAPHALVEPLRLAFGEIAVETSSQPRTLRVRNAGSAPLRFRDLAVEGADRRSFSPVASGCAGSVLEPGTGCAVEVRFRPRRDGPHRAELVIRHNADRGLHRLPLNGIGVSSRLEIEPRALDLGTSPLGTERDGRVTLKNRGRSGLEIRRVRLAGSYARAFELRADHCSGKVLGPAESCHLGVRFAAERRGTRNATLKIDHGGSGPTEVQVTGTATEPPVPEIRLVPGELDFEDRRVGETSLISSFAIENPGTGRLVLRELRLSGAHAADFRIVPGSCDGAEFIAPGADCTVGLRFTPAAAGPRRAELVVYHNAGDGIARLDLRGSGSLPPPVP